MPLSPQQVTSENARMILLKRQLDKGCEIIDSVLLKQKRQLRISDILSKMYHAKEHVQVTEITDFITNLMMIYREVGWIVSVEESTKLFDPSPKLIFEEPKQPTADDLVTP